MSYTTATIETIDQNGRGVAYVGAKAIFIEGALPGEIVGYSSYRKKPSYEVARIDYFLKPSSSRVTAQCPHFDKCGGCAMQHYDFVAQVAAKQRILEDCLWHIARRKPESMLPPVYGPAWAYRHKARLRARYVVAKGRVLVGFNEKHSSFVADMQQCKVLPPHMSALIVPLQQLLFQLSIRDSVPQIEVAIGDNETALILRILKALVPADESLIRQFAEQHSVQIWLQPKGPESAFLFHPPCAPQLSYSLPEFNLVYPFQPTEFTQINPQINRILVQRAMALLKPRPGEKIADFFCGLGNFTLPVASCGSKVVGLEGSAALVRCAQQNAKKNGLSALTEFRQLDLFKANMADIIGLGPIDKWLIDPPRNGAIDLIQAMPEKNTPRRIVYISCKPSTLARDADLLAYKGYRLKHAGIINMFPHTAHVESIAMFEQIADMKTC